MMLMFNNNHGEPFLFQSKLVYFAPEAGPVLTFDDFDESGESSDETSELINTDEKSQDALNKFYEAINTQKLSKDDAVMYQNRVNSLLRDHFLDKTEIEEIDSLVSAIKERITPRWLRIVNGLNDPKKKNSGYFKNQIKNYCWNKSSGAINFKGSRELENKVSLPNMFDDAYLQITINESRRSAKQRGIPENAVKVNGSYILEKSGDNYVYLTPDNSNARAVVQQGDFVKESLGVSRSHLADAEKDSNEKADKLSQIFENANLTTEQGNTYNLTASNPGDLDENNVSTDEFPADLEEMLEKDNASYVEDDSGYTSKTLEKTNLKELGTYLAKQFKKHESALKILGIKNDVYNLNPAEAQKFVNYLTRYTFNSRATKNIKSKVADNMSIIQLFESKDAPIVCRNSMQIVEGCLNALKNISKGPLKSIYVRSVASEYTKNKVEFGTSRDEKGHGLVEMYVAEKDGNVRSMTIDMFQTALGKSSNRIGSLAQIENKKPQQVLDQYAENINAAIEQIQEGGTQLTPNAFNSLKQQIISSFALKGVNDVPFNKAVAKFMGTLDPNNQVEAFNHTRRIMKAKQSMQMASKNNLFLDDNWGSDLKKVSLGVGTLNSMYKDMFDASMETRYLREYNVKKADVKQALMKIWNNLKSIAISQFPGMEEQYNYVISLLDGHGFPTPEVKYVSRKTPEKEKTAA